MNRARFGLLALVTIIGCGAAGRTAPATSGDDSAATWAPASEKWNFLENFSDTDGAAWPARWRDLGGVASATIRNGQGRLVPVTSGYSLARMGIDEGRRDVEAVFDLAFEDIGTQGVGFYVRQNGGWLQAPPTHGQGYAVFVEGFRGSRIGAWREVDGVEEDILPAYTDFDTPLESNVRYRVRFRVKQESPTVTRLRARVWNARGIEPAAWQVDVTDSTPSLQNAAGGIAIDGFSIVTSDTITSGTLVDDITVVDVAERPRG